MPDKETRYLTASEVCRAYGLSRTTLLAKCRAGVFPSPCRLSKKLWSSEVLIEYEQKKKALCWNNYRRLTVGIKHPDD